MEVHWEDRIDTMRTDTGQGMHGIQTEGVYPQSHGRLAIVDIDASKWFVNLWEHLALAIFANFDVKKLLKWLSTKI